MSYFRTTISHGSSGLKSVNVGFPPKGLRITVGARFATVDGCIHFSEGFTANGTNGFCHSMYGDSSGFQSISNNSRIVSQYERVGGVLSEVVAATLDASTAFSGNTVKYDVTTPNANYQFHIEAWD